MKANGLEQICKGLQDQTAKDGRRWSSLIVKSKAGQNLRALSPNSGILLNPSWFKTYWDDYVNQGKLLLIPLPASLQEVFILTILSLDPLHLPSPHNQHASLLRQRRRPSEEQLPLLRQRQHHFPETHRPRHLRLLDRSFRHGLQRADERYHPSSGSSVQP